MGKRIVVLGSFDTKGVELEFLCERIRGFGCVPVSVDVSLGGPPQVPVDVPAGEVARAAGADIAAIRNSRDTRAATRVMVRGASRIVDGLRRTGRMHGIVSIGGASNTGLATAVMASLPFGVPKVMLSSMAAVPAYAGAYFGTRDIAVIHSVVDVAGRNPLLDDVLTRTAGAICGMVRAAAGPVPLARSSGAPLRVAMTRFKFCEVCARHAARLLEAAGVEVIPFHAQGVGDRAMEDLVREGLADGVLDLVPAGVAEELLGGNRAAGPSRLEAAGAMGIPQVVTPCGFDMLSCGPLERAERGDPLWTHRELSQRKLFVPDALRVQARTTAEELVRVADEVARKLNRSRGPVVVLIPTRGWSSLSEPGGPLYEPDADAAFVRRLRQRLSPRVRVRTVDAPLNTEAFAEAAVAELLDAMGVERPDESRSSALRGGGSAEAS